MMVNEMYTFCIGASALMCACCRAKSLGSELSDWMLLLFFLYPTINTTHCCCPTDWAHITSAIVIFRCKTNTFSIRDQSRQKTYQTQYYVPSVWSVGCGAQHNQIKCWFDNDPEHNYTHTAEWVTQSRNRTRLICVCARSPLLHAVQLCSILIEPFKDELQATNFKLISSQLTKYSSSITIWIARLTIQVVVACWNMVVRHFCRMILSHTMRFQHLSIELNWTFGLETQRLIVMLVCCITRNVEFRFSMHYSAIQSSTKCETLKRKRAFESLWNCCARLHSSIHLQIIQFWKAFLTLKTKGIAHTMHIRHIVLSSARSTFFLSCIEALFVCIIFARMLCLNAKKRWNCDYPKRDRTRNDLSQLGALCTNGMTDTLISKRFFVFIRPFWFIIVIGFVWRIFFKFLSPSSFWL